MIDHSYCSIDLVSLHHVGNKNNEEPLIISKHGLDLSDRNVEELLRQYFLNPFKSEEYHRFTFSNGDHTLNPLFRFCKEVFHGISDFHLNTINIAKHLFESSNHPNIKAGDLFVSYISKISVDHRDVDAIGIFKSENKQSLLGIDGNDNEFNLFRMDGIDISKPDKACLIFNCEEEQGFKVCIIDRTNKSDEAQFWKSTFLNLVPAKDEFHQTKGFMEIAKEFVTKALPENFEVNKSDQIDLLNRSMTYFKTHDVFEKEEFETEVFRDENVIESFKQFDRSYREENEMEIHDSFDINLQAVKKQSRVYKSILKLDKNFHIYIHGDKELIVPGVEKDGRKYYKIYYDQES